MATSDPQTQPQAAATAAAPTAGAGISSNISISGGGGSASSPATTDPDVDLVTQLQVCLGQLTTQFYASVNYISTRHPLSAPTEPNASPPPAPSTTSAFPSSSSAAAAAAGGGANGVANGNSAHAAHAASAAAWIDPTINPVTGLDPDNETAPPPPADPAHAPVPAGEFAAALRELAQDLVTKTRQIEALALRLPDLSGGGGNGGEGRESGESETERQERAIADAAAELEALSAQVADARRRRDAARARIEAVVQGWGGGAVQTMEGLEGKGVR